MSRRTSVLLSRWLFSYSRSSTIWSTFTSHTRKEQRVVWCAQLWRPYWVALVSVVTRGITDDNSPNHPHVPFTVELMNFLHQFQFLVAPIFSLMTCYSQQWVVSLRHPTQFLGSHPLVPDLGIETIIPDVRTLFFTKRHQWNHLLHGKEDVWSQSSLDS